MFIAMKQTNLLWLLLLLFTNPLGAEVERQQAIEKPVIALHEALLAIMKNAHSTRGDERYALLEKIVDQYFAIDLIAKVILGRYWKSLDAKTQQDFIASFKRLTILTYVDRFHSFNDEHFKALSMKMMKEKRFIVKTALHVADGETIALHYIVQDRGDGWKIISVIANGINDLSLKRAEYSSVIKNRGFDVLQIEIKKKIENLTAKNLFSKQ